MNRTRIVFFVVLALCLALLAFSAAQQVVSTQALLQLFVASTIFSCGVVLLDFLGILGGHLGGAGASAHAGDAGGHWEGGGSHGPGIEAAGLGQAAGGPGSHLDGSHDGALSAGHGALNHGETGDHGLAGPQGAMTGHFATPVTSAHAADEHAAPAGTGSVRLPATPNGAPVLSALAYLRLLVYFSLGFGPSGLAAVATGRSALASVAIAAPVGLAATLLAQAFFRFQRHDTDSALSPADLLRHEATVIVPLDHQNMGKVRARIGLSVSEQYALAEDDGCTYQRGDVVRITRVTDEVVYVR